MLASVQEIAAGGTVAVRSSAPDEDSDHASFAGMMESCLNVPADERLWDAVKQCYRSCFSRRAMEYRVRNGFSCNNLGMAVIIQRMIEAEYAGVMFTTNPRTNDPDETLISVVRGCGEQLVSGASDSDDYIIDILGQIAEGCHALPLSQDVIRELGETAFAIERSYPKRRAVDIEFCIRNEEIFILQSRPIAAFVHIDKNQPRLILDNSNIIESYSGVVTNLTYTFAQEVYAKIYRQVLHYFGVPDRSVEAIGDDLDHMLAMYENKIYYRMNSWYKMTALYPGYETNKKYMENMMGVKTQLRESETVKPASRLTIYRRFIKKYLTLKKDSEAFRQRFREVTEPLYAQDFAGYDNRQLLRIYAELEKNILDDFITPIANDMCAMVFYGVLTDSLKKKAIPRSDGVISDLLGRQGNVESAAQSERLMDIVEQIRADSVLYALFTNADVRTLQQMLEEGQEDVFEQLRCYVHDYGCRTMDELKLETMTLLEDTAPLIETIKRYLTVELTRIGKAEKEADLRELTNHYPLWERPWIRYLVRRTRFLIRNRESLRLRRTYIYSIVRKLYLRIGENLAQQGILEQPRDIFFLEKPCITDIIEERETDRSRITARVSRNKARYTENSKRETYERLYFYGEMTAENALPVYSAQEVSEHTDVLHGVAGGGGRITGQVKLVLTPEDADVRGKILMAKRTDPGWTVLFPMVRGILIERGSVLSHSAVIAREMGIPLVAGIRGLTEKIQDGDMVELDGISGTVRVIGEKDG